MKVLVIGGTGYIGTVVVRRLAEAGHQPAVLVRDPHRDLPRDTHADLPVPRRRGDLSDPDSLRAAVTSDIDAVVHAATPVGDWDADLTALTALSGALVGRSLIYVSGVWVLGPASDPVDETASPHPIEIVSGRPRLERHVLDATGVHGVVVRPGIVHGAAGGIPAMMVDWARHEGFGRYVGDPTVRWPMVHVDDLADLVTLALDRAPAGTILHAVSEPAVSVKELAAAADLAAGGTGQAHAWAVEEAAAALGAPFAGALALSQEVTANAAHALGWSPTRVDAVKELLGQGDRAENPSAESS